MRSVPNERWVQHCHYCMSVGAEASPRPAPVDWTSSYINSTAIADCCCCESSTQPCRTKYPLSKSPETEYPSERNPRRRVPWKIRLWAQGLTCGKILCVIFFAVGVCLKLWCKSYAFGVWKCVRRQGNRWGFNRQPLAIQTLHSL